MDKKEKIEQEIRKTLAQFDQAEQFPANPWFYTRVQARLEESRNRRAVLSAILRPALLTALVVINLSTAFWYMTGTTTTVQTDSRQKLVKLLANDFNPDSGQSNLLNLK